jgi:hypothetical protein
LVGVSQSSLYFYKLFLQYNILTIHSFILYIYIISFGILIISIEYEFQFSILNFTFLDSWIGRGLFLIFNSTIISLLMSQNQSTTSYFENVLLYALLSFGIIYLLLGSLCCRQLKQREINQVCTYY